MEKIPVILDKHKSSLYTHWCWTNRLPSKFADLWLATPAISSPSNWLGLVEKVPSASPIFFLGAIASPNFFNLLEIWAGEILPSGSSASAIHRLQFLSSLNLIYSKQGRTYYQKMKAKQDKKLTSYESIYRAEAKYVSTNGEKNFKNKKKMLFKPWSKFQTIRFDQVKPTSHKDP